MTFTTIGRRMLAAGALCAFAAPVLANDFTDAIHTQASYTGEAATVVDGGENTGDAYAGQFHIGATLDLQQWLGWNGATVIANVSSRHGDNLADDEIGNSTSVQEIYGGQGERLANLTLKQELMGGRLMIEAGRTVANIHFLGSGLCNYFQLNAACGNPTFVFKTSGFTWWPVSSWGGHAQFWFTPQTYVHVGVYEVNPIQAEDGRHGLNWSTSDATGVIVPVTLGYRTPDSFAGKSRFYEIGGWYDNSDYSDPLYDADGVPAQQSGNGYATENDRAGAFLRFEQQVTQTRSGGRHGLTLFGNYLTRLDGRLVENNFFDLGFVQRGTFASRPDDSVAFVVTRQNYSHAALRDIELRRAAGGSDIAPPGSQTMMELNYGIQATPALKIQPSLIYVIDPDSLADPDRTYNLDNALIVGLRVDWNLSAGLKALVGH